MIATVGVMKENEAARLEDWLLLRGGKGHEVRLDEMGFLEISIKLGGGCDIVDLLRGIRRDLGRSGIYFPQFDTESVEADAKVWVLSEGRYDDSEVLGVYTDKGEGEAEWERLRELNKGDSAYGISLDEVGLI